MSTSTGRPQFQLPPTTLLSLEGEYLIVELEVLINASFEREAGVGSPRGVFDNLQLHNAEEREGLQLAAVS